MFEKRVFITLGIYLAWSLQVCCAQLQCLPSSTINKSGSYILCAPSTETITIDADNVTLDFNGYSIDGSAVSLNHGVVIQPSHHDITIKNGFIRGGQGTLTGISVQGNDAQHLSTVNINNICISATHTGIALSSCENAKIESCHLSNNYCGIALNKTCNSTVEHCSIEGGAFGCYLTNSCYNLFKECKIGALIGGLLFDTCIGFYSTYGSGNGFISCDIYDVQAPHAYGVYIDGPESGSSIRECSINNIVSTAFPTVSYGIYMHYSLWDSTTSGTDISVNCMSWSPNGQYLAVCPYHDGMLYIFQLIHNQLNYVDSVPMKYVTPHGEIEQVYQGNGIIWDFDGKSLIVVGQADVDSEYCFVNSYRVSPTGFLDEIVRKLFSFSGQRTIAAEDVAWIGDSHFVVACYAASALHYYLIYRYNRETCYPDLVRNSYFDTGKDELNHGYSYAVKSFDIYNPVKAAHERYVVFGGTENIGQGTAAVYLFKVKADKTDITYVSNKRLEWAAPNSFVKDVALSDGGTQLAAVGNYYNDDNGGLAVLRLGINDEGKMYIAENFYSNEDMGKSVPCADWLPINRLAYGYIHGGGSSGKPKVQIGELRELDKSHQIFETQIDDLPNPIVDDQIKITSVAWSPDYKFLAYGLRDRLGLFIMPSQCLIQNNSITGVNGIGVYDASGCNIIIQNSAYNNSTDYNANNNSNVTALSEPAMDIAANISCVQNS